MTAHREKIAASNSGTTLAELAQRAGALHRKSVDSWLACAEVLLEARAVAAHGEWTEFLREAGIPERTAQRMIKLARAGVKADTVTFLGGVRATLDAFSVVERWPVETRRRWREAGGAAGEPDGDLRAAAAIEDAFGWWRTFRHAVSKDSAEWDAIIQSVPDGPISTSRWLDFGDAVARAATDAEMRDAMALAPWR